MRLADIAPTLAAARDHRLAQEHHERDLRRWLRRQLTDDERALAHRELQEARAATLTTRRRPRYLAERKAKTAESRQRVAELQARLDALEQAALWNDAGADHWVNRPAPRRRRR